MSASALQELVEYIAKSLVDDPSQVSVTETASDHMVVLELRVGPDDMGKVIGRNGRMARSIRTLLSAAASLEGRKATLDILD